MAKKTVLSFSKPMEADSSPKDAARKGEEKKPARKTSKQRTRNEKNRNFPNASDSQSAKGLQKEQEGRKRQRRKSTIKGNLKKKTFVEEAGGGGRKGPWSRAKCLGPAIASSSEKKKSTPRNLVLCLRKRETGKGNLGATFGEKLCLWIIQKRKTVKREKEKAARKGRAADGSSLSGKP